MNPDDHLESFGDEEGGFGGGSGGVSEDGKKKRAAKKGSFGSVACGGGGGGGSSMKICQAEKCSADLCDAKPYHRRHRVCEHHAKAQVAVVAGIRQRFCQQCSRFHEISEFDESKRSCRRRLAGHNERRRKNPVDNTNPHAQGSRIIKGSAQGAPSLLSSSPSPLSY